MKRILLIDDDTAILGMLEDYFSGEGFIITTAENGKEGVKRYLSEGADLVIMDVLMPEQDGIETIRMLKEYDPEVKVIAISGGGKIEADSYLKMIRHFGAVETLKKPVLPSLLLEAVNEHIT
jgi:CheY-like chemotaxis protein